VDHEKIILVTRKTRLDGLVERFNTLGQAKFYIEHSGGDFTLYEREHTAYVNALAVLRIALQRLAKTQEIERGFLPNFLFAPEDVVVTIGIDGLVVNTAKYLDGQPVVAVNPDPGHIDGILLPFNVQTAIPAVQKVLTGQMQVRQISMAEAALNDGQTLLAFNDLFIGAKTHVSARYKIKLQSQQEHHSSSGIIVSTGVGSTGWLSSLFNMANGMYEVFSQDREHAATLPPMKMKWDSEWIGESYVAACDRIGDGGGRRYFQRWRRSGLFAIQFRRDCYDQFSEEKNTVSDWIIIEFILNCRGTIIAP
jgi:hypothetical protein